MRTTRFVSAAVFSFAVVTSIASGANQQQASPTGICSGRALCYEATDFGATVTVFHVSTNNVYKQKIIDVTVRFQNKTNQPVVLAYVDHSGLATDDRGNRSIPWGPNAYRGIGLVSGNSFDPKLVLRPGGWGDAQFELVQQGNPQATGTLYVLDLTIDEINNSGGQPTLGGEFPLHFEGLADGAAPGMQNVAAPANAAEAIANLKSIFGRKKSVQNAAPAANSTANTVAVVKPARNSASSQSASGNGSRQQGTFAGNAEDTNAQQQTSALAVSSAGPQAKSPAAGNGTSARGSSRNGEAPSQSAEPWTPPTDNVAETAAVVDPLKLPDVAKMPDVVGVRLGMSAQQAAQTLRAQYARDRFTEIPFSGFPANPKPAYGFYLEPAGTTVSGQRDAVVSFTAPPGRQVVWRVVRYTHRIHSSHANVLAALREKYGKESYAGRENGSKTTDERVIGMLIWIFDEHGNRAPMPSAQAFGSNDISFCLGRGIPFGDRDESPSMLTEENKDPNWCASFVGVIAAVDPTEIVENTRISMMDLRLATRTANSYVAWQRDAADRAHAADVEKSKKNKPVF